MKKVFLFISFLFQLFSFAQVQRETRAVWLTTNFAADWPPKTYNTQTQKNDLREIFQNLKSKNFNTVYFQVRSNGTVLYNSSIEPTSPYITGTVGDPLPYDPLQLAIDLGKEFDIEVHAWVNMVRCFTGENKNILFSPKHIKNVHPSWAIRKINKKGKLSYWLNPGLFEVQEYLIRILLEISNNYDIDGIQLDFFRYPESNFNDQQTYIDNNLGMSKDDWRRNNLTEILKLFQQRVQPLNRYLKIGVTPIGIKVNKLGASGLQGFSSLYQDTGRWLRENLVDYLVPQIYWAFENNPRFDLLANDWVQNSYNRNIVLGLAAYKPKVKLELDEMIDYSRKIGAAGISFFRYKNIAAIEDVYFSNIAFPKNMGWKISNEDKSFNSKCKATFLSDNEFLISWGIPSKNNYRYNILYNYLSDSSFTKKILSTKKNKVKLAFVNPKKLQYQYGVGQIDRLWNVTEVCKKLVLNVPLLDSLKKNANVSISPMFIKVSDSISVLSLFSFSDKEIFLEVITKENLISQDKINLFFGQNIIEIKKDKTLIKTIQIRNRNNEIINEMNFL